MANLVVFWIEVLVLVVVICLLGMIARTIAKSQSGLDKKELAVVRPAAGRGLIRFDPSLLLILALCSGPLGLLLSALWCFAYYKHRAAVKKVVGVDPREQNSAEGVIFWFYELRITRTELIKGYEKNAQRIPLRGLTATVTKTDTVDITIKGPDTKFVYSMPYDVLAGFNLRGARQFAALLNYEASRPPTPAPAQHQDGCTCGRCCQQRVAARRLAREDFESEM
jgi:hypothetical protein